MSARKPAFVPLTKPCRAPGCRDQGVYSEDAGKSWRCAAHSGLSKRKDAA